MQEEIPSGDMLEMKFKTALIIAMVIVSSYSQEVMGDLLTNITRNYDKRLRPSANGQADMVYVQIGVVSLGPLDAKSFTFEVDMYLRHWWNDPRLQYNSNASYNYNGNPADVVWVPDTYIENSKKTQLHKVMTENSRAIIKPNGDVFVSMRATATSSCPMDLRLYPFDTQECQLVLSSYSFTGSQLDLNWAANAVTIDTIDGKIHVSSFVYKGTEAKKVVVTMGSQAEKFIVLKCIFKLQRSFLSTISRIFVPSSFLVVLTWATFFIPASSIPARITLIVTNFLATVFITQSTSSKIADVEYTTAIGIYLLANVIFITLALIVLLLVLNLPNKKIKIFKSKKALDQEVGATNDVDGAEMERLGRIKEENFNFHKKEEKKSDTHYLDNYAKIVIPISYLLFVMIYFIYFHQAHKKAEE